MGPDGSARAAGRPRHQLHLAQRRCCTRSAGRRAAGAAAEPRRRLRWRVDVPARRHPLGAVGAADLRQGPGRRRRDGRRLQRAVADDVGVPQRRACGPTSAASTCSTPARRTTTPTTCADGRYVAVGAIEPQFYAELLDGLGLDARRPARPERHRAAGPNCARAFTEAFAAHDRDHWAKVFADTDACVTPVLSFAEVETEPHITERDTFYRRRRQPAADARAAVLPQRARRRRRRRACRVRTPKPCCGTGYSPNQS